MDGWTDGHFRPTLLGRLGGVDLIILKNLYLYGVQTTALKLCNWEGNRGNTTVNQTQSCIKQAYCVSSSSAVRLVFIVCKKLCSGAT